MSINEAGILLIQLSPVKKFWTLDTPKETGSIGSTLRRVETLWGSVLTCQDMVVRHKDFNWSIFDLEQFLLEHSDLGYSCFLYEDPCYQCFLIETVKYSRKCLVVTSLPIWAQQDSMHVMLGIWQCNRVVKGTVNTSCLYEGTERVMCGRCCLAFRRVNRCFSFLWKRITDT